MTEWRYQKTPTSTLYYINEVNSNFYVYGWRYADGSGGEFDWHSTYKGARRLLGEQYYMPAGAKMKAYSVTELNQNTDGKKN